LIPKPEISPGKEKRFPGTLLKERTSDLHTRNRYFVAPVALGLLTSKIEEIKNEHSHAKDTNGQKS
jgi:hypothetical protein